MLRSFISYRVKKDNNKSFLPNGPDGNSQFCFQECVFPRVCFVQCFPKQRRLVRAINIFQFNTDTRKFNYKFASKTDVLGFGVITWICPTFKRLVQSTIFYFNMECIGMLLWSFPSPSKVVLLSQRHGSPGATIRT